MKERLTKAERREQKRPTMKVSGSSVRQIQRLLIERGKKVRNKK